MANQQTLDYLKVVGPLLANAKDLARQKKGGRLGSIDLKKEWDSVILVTLDERYEPVTMHEAPRGALDAALTRPGSKSRNERGQLGISQFISIAELRWAR